ncbi:MAG: nucleotidyltransferase domain-containing protein [Candidatus Woesearchaeota archaeon]
MDVYKLDLTVLEQEIFLLLCVRAGEKLSQRDIAKKLNVSPTAVGNSLKKLISGELVKIEKTKTINFISFNRDNMKAVELKRAENLKNIYKSGLSDLLEFKLAGSTIIVFGSYARGEDTIDSDIDIAAIGRKPKPLGLGKYEQILHRKVNINFYGAWKDINRQLRNNILNGIVLGGGVNL